jgi:hypothetical protein
MQRAVGPAAAKQPHEWRIGAASGALKRRLVERCVGALERLLARDRNADLAVAV